MDGGRAIAAIAVALSLIACESQGEDASSQDAASPADTSVTIADADSELDGAHDAASPDSSGPDSNQVDGGIDGSDAALDAMEAGPVALALRQEAPAGIVVDSTYVYWSNRGLVGAVQRCRIATGCAQVGELFVAGPRYPEDIVIDDKFLFYGSNNGGLLEGAFLDGSGPGFSLAGFQAPVGIAVDDKNLYWTNNDTGALMYCAKTGCPLAVPMVLALGEQYSVTTGIAVDATNVYWSALVNVMTIPKVGGTATVLAQPMFATVTDVAVDGTNVYWTEEVDNGVVMKAPLAGGARVALASGQGRPHGIALDAHYVYWTSRTAGLVQRVPIEGGAPSTIASNQNNPYAITVDDRNVYWTNIVGGSVMMAPKDWIESPGN